MFYGMRDNEEKHELMKTPLTRNYCHDAQCIRCLILVKHFLESVEKKIYVMVP